MYVCMYLCMYAQNMHLCMFIYTVNVKEFGFLNVHQYFDEDGERGDSAAGVRSARAEVAARGVFPTHQQILTNHELLHAVRHSVCMYLCMHITDYLKLLSQYMYVCMYVHYQRSQLALTSLQVYVCMYVQYACIFVS